MDTGYPEADRLAATVGLVTRESKVLSALRRVAAALPAAEDRLGRWSRIGHGLVTDWSQQDEIRRH